MLRICELRMSGSFPTQFYFRTYDHETGYARFRHGQLTVGVVQDRSSISQAEDDDGQRAVHASFHGPILKQEIWIDGRLDGGVMSMARFLRIMAEAELIPND